MPQLFPYTMQLFSQPHCLPTQAWHDHIALPNSSTPVKREAPSCTDPSRCRHSLMLQVEEYGEEYQQEVIVAPIVHRNVCADQAHLPL